MVVSSVNSLKIVLFFFSVCEIDAAVADDGKESREPSSTGAISLIKSAITLSKV